MSWVERGESSLSLSTAATNDAQQQPPNEKRVAIAHPKPVRQQDKCQSRKDCKTTRPMYPKRITTELFPSAVMALSPRFCNSRLSFQSCFSCLSKASKVVKSYGLGTSREVDEGRRRRCDVDEETVIRCCGGGPKGGGESCASGTVYLQRWANPGLQS